MSDVKLSPFYHSAVNAVTKPRKITATSNYFIDRWMPLLGGNGTMIVLALRRDGFLDRRTGECRDEIVISRAELAAAAGMSEDTLTREMGINKKAGKPQNEWLHLFVKKRTRSRRDRRGQVKQEENAYWVAMDDPVHPEDWPKVEEYIRQSEERTEKAAPPTPQSAAPETQNASSVAEPRTQSASSAPQSAEGGPQSAPPTPQSAAPLKSPDSSLLLLTSPDAASPPGQEPIASLFSGEDHPPQSPDSPRPAGEAGGLPALKGRGAAGAASEKTPEEREIWRRGVALGRAKMDEARRRSAESGLKGGGA